MVVVVVVCYKFVWLDSIRLVNITQMTLSILRFFHISNKTKGPTKVSMFYVDFQQHMRLAHGLTIFCHPFWPTTSLIIRGRVQNVKNIFDPGLCHCVLSGTTVIICSHSKILLTDGTSQRFD